MMAVYFMPNRRAEEANHGVGFGKLQRETDGEEDDAVEAENENGEKDVAARAESSR